MSITSCHDQEYIRMTTAFTFLLLAATAVSVTGFRQEQASAGDVSFQALNRFGRALSQLVNGPALEGNVPLQFIPTEEPQLCPGPSCCQADDYASPYRVAHLNSSTATYAGTSYTTFYLRMYRQSQCNAAIDAAGCCQADVQTLWIDVDPSLQVIHATLISSHSAAQTPTVSGTRHAQRELLSSGDPNLQVVHATLNGSPSAVEVEQSALGFRLSLTEALSGLPDSGAIITLTVNSDTDSLCALSDTAPVNGLCNIIVEGGTARDPAACCPQGLSQAPPADTPAFDPSSAPVQCTASAASSGFRLALQSVTAPFSGTQASLLSNYTFVLSALGSCEDAAAVNTCCDMDINAIQLAVSSEAEIQSLELGSYVVPFSLSPASTTATTSAAAAYNNLIINNLAITRSMVPDLGLPLIVTVRLAAGVPSAVPDLCALAADTDPSLGSCSYTFSSTAPFCCPTDSTNSVTQGENVLSPPPPSPPTPPGIDSHLAPPSAQLPDTSMALQYYEGPTTMGNSFTFMLSDHNSASCSMAHCQDAQLPDTSMALQYYEGPATVGNSFTFMVSDHNSASCSKAHCQDGANASVTFTYGPFSEGTLLYTIQSPRHIPLSELCQPGALPGQGSKACAAIIRGPSVYSVVFFGPEDVIIPTPATTLPEVSEGLCSEYKPIADGCVRLDSAAFSNPGDSTVFEFRLRDHSRQATGCTEGAGELQFMVLLTEAGAAALNAGGEIHPSATMIANGIAWPWTGTAPAGEAVQYGFSLGGAKNPSEVCRQGVSPAQTPGTCVVAIIGDPCFSGFATMTFDSEQECTWCSAYKAPDGGGGSSSSAVIGTAVGVSLGVIALAVLAFFLLAAYRKRKQAQGSEAARAARSNMNWESFDNLASPLTAGAAGSGLSASSQDVSNVLLGIPTSPAR
eukprot:gene24620-10241_t